MKKSSWTISLLLFLTRIYDTNCFTTGNGCYYRNNVYASYYDTRRNHGSMIFHTSVYSIHDDSSPGDKSDTINDDMLATNSNEKYEKAITFPGSIVSVTQNSNRGNTRRSFLHEMMQKTVLIVAAVSTATTTTNLSKSNAVDLTIESPSSTTQTSLSSSSSVYTNPNFVQQFETAGMIPRIYFEEKRSIYGFVERVTDGDTIRISHVPTYTIDGKIPTPIQKRGISDITIAVRLYGIDAPEVAKNKNQTSQPYGDDAKQYTYDTIYHKMVKVTLLQKDKYGRVVGVVETIGNNNVPPKDLSIELAKQGLAELYTGGGAQYWVRHNDCLVIAYCTNCWSHLQSFSIFHHIHIVYIQNVCIYYVCCLLSVL
jgi:endonuclease YncB( thermonuclease family)